MNEKALLETHKPDFMGVNGLFNRIMNTVCKTERHWDFNAVKLNNGTILLYHPERSESQKYFQHFGPDSVFVKENQNDFDMGFYMGHRITHLMTRQPKDYKEPVNELAKSFVIQTSHFGDFKLLVFREVKAVDSRGPKAQNCEIQMRKVKTQKKRNFNTSMKLLRWWSQCVSFGVKSIVFGYRSGDKLVRIEECKVGDIPGLLESLWTLTDCFKILDDVLKQIKATVTETDKVYKVEFKTNVEMVEIKETNDCSDIPEWFLDLHAKVQ